MFQSRRLPMALEDELSLLPERGPGQSKLGVYQLKLHMAEETWGALNTPCINFSTFMRNLGWLWKSWVSKLYSLLTWRHITLFSLLLQESFLLRPQL
jgi:hypothetical protein